MWKMMHSKILAVINAQNMSYADGAEKDCVSLLYLRLYFHIHRYTIFYIDLEFYISVLCFLRFVRECVSFYLYLINFCMPSNTFILLTYILNRPRPTTGLNVADIRFLTADY